VLYAHGVLMICGGWVPPFTPEGYLDIGSRDYLDSFRL
jgi:hypothetical protein